MWQAVLTLSFLLYTFEGTAEKKNKRFERKILSTPSSLKTDSYRNGMSSREANENEKKTSSTERSTKSSHRRSKSAAPTVRNIPRTFLGNLAIDRLYLENLLLHPGTVNQLFSLTFSHDKNKNKKWDV